MRPTLDLFLEDISKWVDPDGLIGSCENPPKWSTGNGILETAFAIHYIFNLSASVDGLGDEDENLKDAILKCKSPNGSFYKNPGRLDQITHDDLMGAASGSAGAAISLSNLGEKKFWNLSNDGSWYWDAWAKPWQVAIYKLCACFDCNPIWVVLLQASILVQAVGLFLNILNPSNDRILWLCLNSITVGGKLLNPMQAFVTRIWKSQMKKRYGDVSTLMADYYQTSYHPYVTYGKYLDF